MYSKMPKSHVRCYVHNFDLNSKSWKRKMAQICEVFHWVSLSSESFADVSIQCFPKKVPKTLYYYVIDAFKYQQIYFLDL